MAAAAISNTNGTALRTRPQDGRAVDLYAGERRPASVGDVIAVLRKSWPFISGERRLIALKSGLALISLSFFLLMPWPMKLIIDNVINGRPLTGVARDLLSPLTGDDRLLLLGVLCGFLVIAMVLTGMYGNEPHDLRTDVESGGMDLLSRSGNAVSNGWSLWNGLLGFIEVQITLNLTQRMNHSLRTAIYNKFLRSPLRLYSDQKIGDAIFRVMLDSSAIGPVLYEGVLGPVMAITMFAIAIVVLRLHFPNEPLIAVLAGVALVITVIGTAIFGGALRGQGQQMRERGSAVMAAFEERLANVHAIKAFGQEAREHKAIDSASWGSYEAGLRMVSIVMVLLFVCGSGIALLIGYALYHVMGQVIRDQITLGDVVLLAGYAVMLGRPMVELGSTWAKLQEPAAGLRRVHSVLDRLNEDGGEHERDFDEPIQQIELRNLSVGYSPDEPTLSGVDLTLRRGELSGLAGRSGVGKTTLISALPRLHDPLEGTVMINGVDAKSISRSSLRRRIAFVFQQEALFSMSLLENIRYGKPEASNEEVVAAAAMVGAAEFIEKLPDGYKTMLGRRGARLSVGQKQRIAIARALLTDPDVLVLDEPMAPLDRESELALMAMLRQLAARKIVLLVAHRPETLAQCDKVYFVDEKTLAASGRHLDLMRSVPAYSSYLASSV